MTALELVRADPAGNVTLLVLTAVAAERRAETARALLERCGGEQVGFFSPPRQGGDCRLEMMGGEFCGNALRAAGRWWAAEHPAAAMPLAAEISGCDRPLNVWVSGEHVRAELPLPALLTQWEGLDAAVFPGIVHVLCPDAACSRAHARSVTRALCRHFAAPAAGVMYLSPDRRAMRPAVFVQATDTLFFESSCASGSAAAAALLSREVPEGPSVWPLRQPGGVITASARREGGVLTALAIAGEVALDAPGSVELPGA